jgi:hypothetical protein
MTPVIAETTPTAASEFIPFDVEFEHEFHVLESRRATR